MKTEKKNIGSILFVLCFLVFIFVFAILNIDLTIEPLDNLLQKETGFSGFVEEVQSAYLSDELSQKNSFLNLNGAFARATGRNSYNEVVLLENGMLTSDFSKTDITMMASEIGELNAFMKERNTPFAYIQAPYKVDIAETLLPTHIENYGNETADELLALLKENNVDTLDLRPYLSSNAELVEKYFYKTDHHWNYSGAFEGFRIVSEKMQKMLPNESIDISYAQIEQWNSYTFEKWFLGSHGKRVGTLFAGVDDMVYYTPKFETTISTAIPKYRTLTKGDFSDANIRSEYLDEPNYFTENPYCIYIGGDYPLVQHRNADAPNDLKVLMIKDSYMLPVQAYMSTLFSAVDVIDPRYFTECSIPDYIERTNPDVVLIMINPPIASFASLFDFDLDSTQQKTSESVIEHENEHELTAKPRDFNYSVFGAELNPGKTYALRFCDVEFLQGQADGVTVALYNSSTETVISARVFDVEYYRGNGSFEWLFDTPEEETGELQLLLYSGIAGQTAGIHTVYKNISLSVQEIVQE